MASKFQTVRGMRDFLPADCRKKKQVEAVCREVFASFGFEPLQTPVVEPFELLSAKGSAGEAIKDEVYWFKDKGDREVGLRFDLTVPLGRVVASNPQLPKPFKRYQIGTVYRYDRPQAKRYREFTQADVDIVGVSDVTAEFEIIAIAVKIMQRLELDFFIKLNSRPVLERIALKCNVKKEQIPDCFRLIDKQDKSDWKTIDAELKQKGIDPKIAKVLQENNLVEIEKLVGRDPSFESLLGLMELLSESGLDKFVKLDFALARGLDYYTGTVFEVSSENTTVAAGGRYDKLVEQYGGPATPCVGISFGVDRLFDLVSQRWVLPAVSRVLVVCLDSKQQGYAFKVAESLRKAGVNVESDLLFRNIGKNIEYAVKKGIPMLAIVGENEAKEQKVTLKNLAKKTQFLVPLSQAGSFLANSN
ncbi:MAG: histidine--tRNA ligase [Candidatus Diapherotrites archaeon]|uniref:Histidine--tRNA ligase n=1 Tax=Candidatus Iainarchaeum sp. TaxID=3101447 RepID=A0A8T4L7I1_9ARCH|nr:histidine--tRNA ligase [Candidatus Diapherotrites archaeon]